jgi:hypothetical protein
VFSEAFAPQRKLLVGADGIALDSFLSRPAEILGEASLGYLTCVGRVMDLLPQEPVAGWLQPLFQRLLHRLQRCSQFGLDRRIVAALRSAAEREASLYFRLSAEHLRQQVVHLRPGTRIRIRIVSRELRATQLIGIGICIGVEYASVQCHLPVDAPLSQHRFESAAVRRRNARVIRT